MSKAKPPLRSQLRWIHILASIALGTFLYSPWRNNPTFTLSMSIAVFPILALTGLWMWQGPRISQWLKRDRSGTEVNEADR